MPITVIGQETFGPVTLGDISARGGHWWKRPNAALPFRIQHRRRSTGQLGYHPGDACHCAIEPLHGSACATITAERNATPAAVITQLMVLARFLPATLRTVARPEFIVRTIVICRLPNAELLKIRWAGTIRNHCFVISLTLEAYHGCYSHVRRSAAGVGQTGEKHS
jgi:hypothetical protein